MFDLFKDEAGECGPSKTIECDGFVIYYMRFTFHIEISFCETGAANKQFAFIICNQHYQRVCYWCMSVIWPKTSCPYSEFFDWMIENKPNVAEWLLFNSI